MNKRKLAVLFIAKTVTIFLGICSFYPLYEPTIKAFQYQAVRQYAYTSTSASTGFQLSADEVVKHWRSRMASNCDVGMIGDYKITRIDLERRYRKMPIEFSTCAGCEAPEEFLQREADAKIAEVQQMYATHRAYLVLNYGEEEVAKVESRHQSYETTMDERTWWELALLLAACYLLSALAHVPFLCVKAHLHGFRWYYELITPDRIPLVALGYPVLETGFPVGSPIENLKRVLNYAAWLLMSVVGWGVNIASAQGQASTQKPGTKTPSGYVFTVDARQETELMEGGGKTITLRTMLTKTGRRPFLETFFSGKMAGGGNAESFLVTPGVTLVRKKWGDNKLTVNAVGGLRHLRSENAAGVVSNQNRLVVGAEVFASGRNFQFFNSANRFEREAKKGGAEAYLFTAQLLGRASPGKRFWAGTEGSFTKQWGRRVVGYTGGVAAFDPKPGKSRLEVGVFKSLLPAGNGPVSIRARLIYNFAF